MEQDQEPQNGRKAFCANAGLFGVLLSVNCVGLQQLFFFSSQWIVLQCQACIYRLCVVNFVLLIKKAPSALLLLISGILMFLFEVFNDVTSMAFSWC